MVQMHSCATKVEEVSTFHETLDTKIAILTFLSQANIHLELSSQPLTFIVRRIYENNKTRNFPKAGSYTGMYKQQVDCSMREGEERRERPVGREMDRDNHKAVFQSQHYTYNFFLVIRVSHEETGWH